MRAADRRNREKGGPSAASLPIRCDRRDGDPHSVLWLYDFLRGLAGVGHHRAADLLCRKYLLPACPPLLPQI